MEEIDLLYSHYNDTFSILKDKEKKRDRLFIILFLLMMLLFLFSINQDSMYQMIKEFIKNKTDISLAFGFNVVLSFLWIILFYSTIKYYQIVVHINRGYEYLHKLEATIDSKVDFKFERESKAYLDEYPILYVVIVYYKIILEWQSTEYIFNNILNTIMATLIIIATVFYFFALHPKLNKNLHNN